MLLEKPILLPSAWKGDGLHEEDWIINLPDPLVEELTVAANELRYWLKIASFTRKLGARIVEPDSI